MNEIIEPTLEPVASDGANDGTATTPSGSGPGMPRPQATAGESPQAAVEGAKSGKGNGAAAEEKAAPARQGETWWEFAKTIAYALLIALVIRTFLFQPFNIPSGSMKGTLLVGDYLFVEKFAYGYSRYSFPMGLGPFSGRILAFQPHRGDVVVFKYPRDNSTDYIKRLIGLPGDRVQIVNGVPYINGQAIGKARIKDWFGFANCDPNDSEEVCGDTETPANVAQYRETLPGGKSYLVLESHPEEPCVTNTDVFVVPPGYYFMMGDNRENSSDSRFPNRCVPNDGVGYVPAENLEGKAIFRFFSTDGSILQFWKWRFDRMFTGID